MLKLNRVQKITRKSWLVGGMILSLAIMGAGGCGTATSSPAASSTPNSTTSSQQTQEQTAQRPALNPAVEAAMSIRRLQSDQQMVLTSDQKDKIKPILQLLIDTSNPSQDFLQEKADAITAVFTEQQKTYLSTNTPKGNPDRNNQNGKEQPKDGQNGAPNGNQTAPAGQSQDIFKQVLASLT